MNAAADPVRYGAFTWSEERGEGYYPVANAADTYDDAYFTKYQGYAATEQGRALTAARVSLVRRLAPSALVVDFGCGCGQFIEAHGNALGHDIMPPAIEWLNERGLYANPWIETADVLTAWDSLEHIENPGDLIDRIGSMAFISTPIYRDRYHVLASKHFRPDEHFWYWTGPGLIGLFNRHGFRCLHMNRMEELHGREDIGTFVFERVEPCQ